MQMLSALILSWLDKSPKHEWLRENCVEIALFGEIVNYFT